MAGRFEDQTFSREVRGPAPHYYHRSISCLAAQAAAQPAGRRARHTCQLLVSACAHPRAALYPVLRLNLALSCLASPLPRSSPALPATPAWGQCRTLPSPHADYRHRRQEQQTNPSLRPLPAGCLHVPPPGTAHHGAVGAGAGPHAAHPLPLPLPVQHAGPIQGGCKVAAPHPLTSWPPPLLASCGALRFSLHSGVGSRLGGTAWQPAALGGSAGPAAGAGAGCLLLPRQTLSPRHSPPSHSHHPSCLRLPPRRRSSKASCWRSATASPPALLPVPPVPPVPALRPPTAAASPPPRATCWRCGPTSASACLGTSWSALRTRARWQAPWRSSPSRWVRICCCVGYSGCVRGAA